MSISRSEDEVQKVIPGDYRLYFVVAIFETIDVSWNDASLRAAPPMRQCKLDVKVKFCK